MSKPVRIMTDGMSEEPIAIPFPFEIGDRTIANPDDWHTFLRERNNYLLGSIASLTCDHMGDVMDDIQKVLDDMRKEDE
jgi:hypothetical protein